MKSAVWIVCIMLCGCTSYHGLKGSNPYAGDVHTLQPTLRWQSSTDPEVAYDLIVYERIRLNQSDIPGRIVCYAEGLTRPEYTVPRPLRNKGKYLWTVRERRGERVGHWSVRDQTVMAGLAYSWKRNEYYHFKVRAQ